MKLPISIVVFAILPVIISQLALAVPTTQQNNQEADRLARDIMGSSASASASASANANSDTFGGSNASANADASAQSNSFGDLGSASAQANAATEANGSNSSANSNAQANSGAFSNAMAQANAATEANGSNSSANSNAQANSGAFSNAMAQANGGNLRNNSRFSSKVSASANASANSQSQGSFGGDESSEADANASANSDFKTRGFRRGNPRFSSNGESEYSSGFYGEQYNFDTSADSKFKARGMRRDESEFSSDVSANSDAQEGNFGFVTPDQQNSGFQEGRYSSESGYSSGSYGEQYTAPSSPYSSGSYGSYKHMVSGDDSSQNNIINSISPTYDSSLSYGEDNNVISLEQMQKPLIQQMPETCSVPVMVIPYIPLGATPIRYSRMSFKKPGVNNTDSTFIIEENYRPVDITIEELKKDHEKAPVKLDKHKMMPYHVAERRKINVPVQSNEAVLVEELPYCDELDSSYYVPEMDYASIQGDYDVYGDNSLNANADSYSYGNEYNGASSNSQAAAGTGFW